MAINRIRKNMSEQVIEIMVLNQNGLNWLGPLYKSIRFHKYPRLKIQLVDNASTDSSVERTQKEYSEVPILRISSNLGYCMSSRQGMKQALVVSRFGEVCFPPKYHLTASKVPRP